MSKKLIPEIYGLLLILLFAYTAFSKSLSFSSFITVIQRFPLLHKEAAIVATLVVAAEYVTVLLLLFPQTKLPGLYLSLALLVLFTCYILYMLAFAKTLPCNCGGVINKMNWKQHLVFNLFFIAVSVCGIITYKRIAIRRSRKPV